MCCQFLLFSDGSRFSRPGRGPYVVHNALKRTDRQRGRLHVGTRELVKWGLRGEPAGPVGIYAVWR